MLRLPSLLLLLNAMYDVAVAMCADQQTRSAQAWLAPLRRVIPARESKAAPAIMWSAFVAACVAQCSNTLLRSLELISPRDDPSTFNLGSFGFVLHIHSTTREFAPNAHVFMIVGMQLFELFGLGVLACRRPPLLSRLVFTSALYGALLVHYVATAASGEYPVLHSASRLSELCVLGVIVLTVALHALTMYLVEGRVEFERLLFSPSSRPRLTDDYAIASLKLGSACLHATHLTSLSCELDPLDAPLQTYVELQSNQAVVQPSVDDLEEMELHGVNGLGKEVKDVRVTLDRDGDEVGGVVRGIDKLREGWHFLHLILQVLYELLYRAVVRWLPPPPEFVRRIPRAVRLFWHGTNGERARDARLAIEARRREQASAARERLASLRERQREKAASSSTALAPHRWLAAEDLDPVELLTLASDEVPERGAFHDMVVKHLMRPDHAPPLTRREYQRIASSSDAGGSSWLAPLRSGAPSRDAADRNTQQALLKLLQERRQAAGGTDLERTRLCVVCCTEERTVICWPCRCVALCDTCREALAAQQHATLSLGRGGRTAQLCPTCRTPVIAYSRLYLP